MSVFSPDFNLFNTLYCAVIHHSRGFSYELLHGDNCCMVLFLWCCLFYFCYFSDFITNNVAI
ncbi:hypothetical protein DDI_4141 [Dickeya dianthicola RNS04.9]|nr:hypothetical protein DDI_4141 [Dickeya dianthicola RNS04.9]